MSHRALILALLPGLTSSALITAEDSVSLPTFEPAGPYDDPARARTISVLPVGADGTEGSNGLGRAAPPCPALGSAVNRVPGQRTSG